LDDFKTFYREVRIRRELTTPYNPQQNGVAERKNRSIEESIKEMMNDQNLSMFLWGEVIMTTVYVQNRIPHHILKSMTPEESFFGKNPSVENVRVFGCQSRRNNGRKL
jgi:transposase InsO family protein